MPPLCKNTPIGTPILSYQTDVVTLDFGMRHDSPHGLIHISPHWIWSEKRFANRWQIRHSIGLRTTTLMVSATTHANIYPNNIGVCSDRKWQSVSLTAIYGWLVRLMVRPNWLTLMLKRACWMHNLTSMYILQQHALYATTEVCRI